MSVVSFVETEPLHSLAELRRDKSQMPKERGIYGLFFRRAPGPVPIHDCYAREDLVLLYIGTAGADLSKKGTLHSRLGSNHLRGNERRSTVCQTLATLLPDIAGLPVLKCERGKIKVHTSVAGAQQLRDWMDENISACWIKVARPADFEGNLISKYTPPLNLDFCDHPFSMRLRALREERRKAAK